jgi:hypothetical protein
MVVLIVIRFTKLNLWFPIKLYYLFILLGVFFVLRFLEIHRENKKRREFISEIRGGY